MKPRQLVSKLVFAGGVIELLIAFLHFIWPIQLVKIGEFASLSTDYKNFLALICIRPVE